MWQAGGWEDWDLLSTGDAVHAINGGDARLDHLLRVDTALRVNGLAWEGERERRTSLGILVWIRVHDNFGGTTVWVCMCWNLQYDDRDRLLKHFSDAHYIVRPICHIRMFDQKYYILWYKISVMNSHHVQYLASYPWCPGNPLPRRQDHGQWACPIRWILDLQES